MAVKIADTLGKLGKGFWLLNAVDAGLSDGRDVETVLKEVEALAKGKNKGYVFDTKAEMEEALTKSEVTSKLLLGDNLYIRELNVPDYWWDGTKACQLETQKVDLTAYLEKDRGVENAGKSLIVGDDGMVTEGFGIGGGTALDNQPLGTVIAYMGQVAPENYLACDGKVYDIAKYKELADFIKLQFGSYDYFGGDGTLTFAVPDLSGEFLRGTGENGHTNQGDGANVGEHQDGTIFPNIWKDNNGNTIGYNNAYSDELDSVVSKSSERSWSTKGGNLTSETTATFTSRPTNTSVLYCIKYRSTELDLYFNYEDYSEEERVIGRYTDGRPLYRKTLHSTTTYEKNKTHLIHTVDSSVNITKVDGWVKSTSGNVVIDINTTVTNETTATNSFAANVYYRNSDIYFRPYGNDCNEYGINIYYTKTTDEANSFTTDMVINNVPVNGVSYEDYSEDEICIGKWTNGKPIYRKTIKFTYTKQSGVTATILICTISDMDTPVKYSGFRKTSNNYAVPIPYTLDGQSCDLVITPNKELYYYDTSVAAHGSYIGDCQITFEYTKTTDEENSFKPSMVKGGLEPKIIADDLYFSMDKYSEEEQIVGEWTNGKPLYRKLVIGTTNATTSSDVKISTGIVNGSNARVVDGFINGSNGYNHPLNYTAGNIIGFCDITENGSEIFVRGTNTNTINRPVYVVVEYTKTTDSVNSFKPSMITNNIPVAGVSYENYSEDEICIGKWIDGKPLYRKVVSGTLGKTDVSIATPIPNIEASVNTLGYIIENGKYVPIGFYNGSAFISAFYYPSKQTMEIRCSTAYVGSQYYIVLEYTKTTDLANSFTPDMVTGGMMIDEEATELDVEEVWQ